MKIKFKLLTILTILSLCSCNTNNFGSGNITPEDNFVDRITPSESKIANFENGFPQGFWVRNDRGNGHPFNCSFSKDNIEINNGTMDLSLTKNGEKYVGAEFCSIGYFGYGYYSVSMKAVKCPGVISSFFTYTGHPWHEIDIEFLGDDTTKVQFNHYTNGIGHHEYYYKLGFDASLDYHEYGFLWTEGSLVYYVDGKAVYKTSADIPYVEGRIMMNLWNVADSNKEWAGKFDDSYLPVKSSYKWVGYQSI